MQLAALVRADQNVEPEDLLAALRLVQTLEPAGVGARSLQECLLLQLGTLPDTTTGIAIAALVGERIEFSVDQINRLQQLLGQQEPDLHVPGPHPCWLPLEPAARPSTSAPDGDALRRSPT